MALCCDDPIDGEVKRSEHWSYVGQGRGAYETVSAARLPLFLNFWAAHSLSLSLSLSLSRSLPFPLC